MFLCVCLTEREREGERERANERWLTIIWTVISENCELIVKYSIYLSLSNSCFCVLHPVFPASQVTFEKNSKLDQRVSQSNLKIMIFSS